MVSLRYGFEKVAHGSRSCMYGPRAYTLSYTYYNTALTNNMSWNNPFERLSSRQDDSYLRRDKAEGTARHRETIRPAAFNIKVPRDHAYADENQVRDHLLPTLKASGASVAFRSGTVRENEDGSRSFTVRLEGTYDQIAAAAKCLRDMKDVVVD